MKIVIGFVPTAYACAPFSLDALVRYRDAEKIAMRFLFGGNPIRQPSMKDRPYRVGGALANADTVVDRTVWIGVFPGRSHLDAMIDRIKTFIPRAASGPAMAE